ncbi:hypothetical protein [Rhizobium sp. LC145]|uniref:hypothetical protein n=1 Tax=Rhizobium sp. LC145 TaxID=1120688 RepID=UPI00062A335D|nr:hypothetical protein [Rhizobium sp. LC145]KKX24334.1 hypothetical protein YH62_27695 [Rhizobium sp. LC145]TKT46151.1 hypothetical protein FDR95_23610 [Rhizobiaceae bacterium LC148]
MTQDRETGRQDRNADARASDRKIHFGWFQAKYLWPLLPFVEYAREIDQLRFLDGNILLEPCTEGGAYLVAVTGHASVIIRDPEARIDTPVTLDIPDQAFYAAKGIEIPTMDYCGERYQPEAPEWLQPGTVYVYSAGMHISPKMRNPIWAEEDDEFHPTLFSRSASVRDHTVGLDYRMTEGVKVRWRQLLKNMNQAPLADASTVYFNPRVPALFSELLESLWAENAHAPIPHVSHTMTVGEKASAIIMRFSGHPDVIGLWAGMQAQENGPEPIPSHFLASETPEGGR